MKRKRRYVERNSPDEHLDDTVATFDAITQIDKPTIDADDFIINAQFGKQDRRLHGHSRPSADAISPAW